MDLQLTHRGDYAVRAAIALASPAGTDGYTKLRDVSASMAIPLRYTQEILTHLMRAGLVEARAGKKGGYRLRRSPAEISLLEIVEAAEGSLGLERCTMNGGPCHWQESVCAVHGLWEQANGALISTLRSHSLARVAEIDARLRERQAGHTPDAASTVLPGAEVVEEVARR